MNILSGAGARVIAEDLGVIPDFVRATLDRLQIPGYKVLRWEREWDEKGKPFKDPRAYPPYSVATSGTHDTEPMAEWWEAAPPGDRASLAAIAQKGALVIDPAAPFDDAIRDAILELLYAAASDIVLLPIQDVFGWKDRINTPALISDENWRWRLPWVTDDLPDEPAAHERARFVHRLAESGRS
jgi:4-alpha-glucanotransferase